MSAHFTSLGPVRYADRMHSIDMLRGIAVLGILLLNIVAMGLPFAYHHPGPMSGWNLRVWEMNELFFEGTMRGLFTMLFGAGVVLLTRRGKEKGEGIAVADVYYRRLLWLLLLGLIHAYLLLFHGEVLFYYALLGLLLFPLRKARPLPLLVAGLLLLGVPTFSSIQQYRHLVTMKEKATLAERLRERGNRLTSAQTASLEAWEGELAKARITPGQMQQEVEQMRGGYATVFENNSQKVKLLHTLVFHDFFFWDFLGFMLLGMALYKWGVFQSGLSRWLYGVLVVIGYGIGLPLNLYEIDLIEKGSFSPLAYGQAAQTYQLGRVLTTLGHIGLVLLLIKTGRLVFMQRALAAVGRTALTNYVIQSVFALFVFTGVGLGLYGRLERYQLYYVVGVIWIFQLVTSLLWLHYFHFGPLEWLWRCLTYQKLQPLGKEGNPDVTECSAGKPSECELRASG